MKKYFVTALGVLLLLCCGGCGGPKTEQAKNIDTAMGTVIQQSVYATENAEAAVSDISEILRRLEEDELSRRLDTAELYAINSAAGEDAGIEVSEEMSQLLDRCLDVWRESDGALDITIGGVVGLWDIDSWAGEGKDAAFMPPTDEELQAALAACGGDKLRKQERMLFLPEGMQIDLGAVGKGIALDRILAYLGKHENVTGAIFSVGGSILTYGQKPDGSCWRVGVTDPADTAANIGTLKLEGQWCVSTSGDYERYVEVDGVRYHHIIDPATGCPADSGVAGVTILSRDGFLSDALSTACFILGAERGIPLAEHYGAEALFVGKDGSIIMTDGMREYFEGSRAR